MAALLRDPEPEWRLLNVPIIFAQERLHTEYICTGKSSSWTTGAGNVQIVKRAKLTFALAGLQSTLAGLQSTLAGECWEKFIECFEQPGLCWSDHEELRN